jgi:poly-gamma-glutamate capsule biosynthesis protein CapA/YwtB (metallophosphatase superfamily)
VRHQGVTTRRLLGSAALLACAAVAAGTLPGPPDTPGAPDAPDAPVPVVVLAGADDAPAPRPEPEPQPEPESEPREVSILMGGDLLWHDSVWQSAARDGAASGSAYDFDPMFADVRPLVHEADVAICHEEVPFAPPGEPLSSYPLFAAPSEIGGWIASTGFDACTTASNHSVDRGWDGLVHTADVLERAGVRHVGTFRSRAERRRPVVLTTAAGVRVGIVAGTYGLNGLPMPEGRPWAVSLWDADNLLRQARAARRAGADVVVVHLHGGAEYDHDPTAEQVALVDRLTRSPDVDLVLGEHAHVVQPITRVRGTWVAYGMGNLVAQQEVTRPDTYEGVLVRFTFREQPDGRFEARAAAYVPLVWNHTSAGPIRVQRISRALRERRDAPVSRQRLLEARASIRAVVTALGRPRGLVER